MKDWQLRSELNSRFNIESVQLMKGMSIKDFLDDLIQKGITIPKDLKIIFFD